MVADNVTCANFPYDPSIHEKLNTFRLLGQSTITFFLSLKLIIVTELQTSAPPPFSIFYRYARPHLYAEMQLYSFIPYIISKRLHRCRCHCSDQSIHDNLTPYVLYGLMFGLIKY